MDLTALSSSWIVYALPYCITAIITNLTAEAFPGRMIRFVFLMRLFGFLATLPIIAFLPLPRDPVFYMAVLGSAVLFAYTDLIYYGLVSKNSAGAVARIEPLSSWFLFFAWAALNPALMLAYLASPVQLIGLVASLTFCVYFALRLRKCAVSWGILRRAGPMMLMIVAGTVMSKTAMVHGGENFHSAIWYYVFLQAGFAAGFYALLFRLKTLPFLGDLDFEPDAIPQRLFTRRAACYALVATVGLLTAQPLKYYAISLADNPAYVTAFGLLGPLWIMLVYRLRGQRETVDVVSGLGILASTAALVFFTQIHG